MGTEMTVRWECDACGRTTEAETHEGNTTTQAWAQFSRMPDGIPIGGGMLVGLPDGWRVDRDGAFCSDRCKDGPVEAEMAQLATALKRAQSALLNISIGLGALRGRWEKERADGQDV